MGKFSLGSRLRRILDQSRNLKKSEKIWRVRRAAGVRPRFLELPPKRWAARPFEGETQRVRVCDSPLPQIRPAKDDAVALCASDWTLSVRVSSGTIINDSSGTLRSAWSSSLERSVQEENRKNNKEQKFNYRSPVRQVWCRGSQMRPCSPQVAVVDRSWPNKTVFLQFSRIFMIFQDFHKNNRTLRPNSRCCRSTTKSSRLSLRPDGRCPVEIALHTSSRRLRFQLNTTLRTRF